MRINEQGRSMIEMLGVLAIVGVLSVGGIAGYSKAMNKFKTNKAIDQVNMLATNIRTLYSSQRTYAGLNNYVAIDTGAAPAEMYDLQAYNDSATRPTIESVLTNSFSGHVQIAPAPVDSADDNMGFVIAIDGVPSSSCVSIVTTDWGGEAGSGLAAIKVAEVTTGDNAVNASSVLEDLQETNATLSSNAGDDLAIQGDDTYGFPFGIVSATSSCGRNVNAAIAWKFM